MGRTADNARWSFLGLGVKVTVQAVAAFAIARIVGLNPYSTMSIGLIYVTVTNLLLDQGMGQALIRNPNMKKTDVATVQVMSIVLALGAMVLTWAIAIPAGHFYSDLPGLAGVLIGLSLGLIFKALWVPGQAVLQRDFQFKWLAMCGIVSSVIGVTVSLISAIMGAEAQALVFQMLVTDSLFAAGVLMRSGFFFRGANLTALRDMAGMSSQIAGSQWLGFISRNADNMLIGKWLGGAALAQYSVSYRLMMLPITNLTMVANRVLLPTYSRLQDDLSAFRRSFLKSTRLMALTAAPTMALLVVFAAPLILGVMGTEWKAAIVPTQVLAIVAIVQAQSSLITPAIIAFGRTRWQLYWSLISTILTVIVFVITVPFGLNVVCVGYCALTVFTLPVPIGLVGRLGGFQLRHFLRSVAPGLAFGLIALLVGTAVRIGLDQLDLPNVVVALVGGLIASVGAVIVLRLVMPSALKDLMVLLPRRSAPTPSDPLRPTAVAAG